MRARDVAERPAGILLGMENAEAAREIRGVHDVDGHGEGAVQLACLSHRGAATQGVRMRLALAALVVQRLVSPDPLGFLEDCPEFAGGLHPVDAPHVAAKPAILGVGSLRVEVAGHTAAK